MSNKLIFLGGTCNNSTWREELIPNLVNDYFNPVVPDWNDEAYRLELEMRDKADIVLYYITPKMTGVYSIAEVVDDSNKRPAKTVFYFALFDEDSLFELHQTKSLIAVGKMVQNNGGFWATSREELINYLNK